MSRRIALAVIAGDNEWMRHKTTERRHHPAPPADAGLLPGVLRQDLLDRGEIAERSLPRTLLAQADACWFINSVRGWLPARPA